MNLQNIKRASYLLLVAVTFLFLTACGGGDNTPGDNPPGSTWVDENNDGFDDNTHLTKDGGKYLDGYDYQGYDIDGYLGLPKYLTNGVKDITFSRYLDKYNQGMLNESISSNIAPGLVAQSNAIKNQYNDWRPTGTKSTEFANTIRELENVIYDEYYMTGENPGLRVVSLKDKHDGIATALGGLFDNQNDANLFRTRLNAFRTASYINQRNQGDRGAGKAAELETLLKQIEQLSGNQIVRGDNTIRVLITDLINTVPETAGPGRYNLLQQLEDFSQLGAFVDDVRAVGLKPALTSFATIIQPSDARLA
jgi:hypothetical protein